MDNHNPIQFTDKHKILLEGYWNENTRWEFHLSKCLPPAGLCTAVFCLGILEGDIDKIVLTRTKRGWEMLGGHIEVGESIETAMLREALEEGGFSASKYKLFGYRKIIVKEPILNERTQEYYPYPISYIPHFIATSREKLKTPTGIEVFESSSFSFSEIKGLNIVDEGIIQEGLYGYIKAK